MTSLKVLSFNIHKGFSALNERYVLPQIRERIRTSGADVVFVQEALGAHHGMSDSEIELWRCQYEYLAEDIWPNFAYGQNAITEKGHHGNALLSRFPIVASRNVDISTNAFERRGVLIGEVLVSPGHRRCYCLCTHLNLLAGGRRKQLHRLVELIAQEIPADAPLILAGDFNDWREESGEIFRLKLGLTEAFQVMNGRHAKSFPALWPLLALDRIYLRGFEVLNAVCFTDRDWRHLSDHAAISADLGFA